MYNVGDKGVVTSDFLRWWESIPLQHKGNQRVLLYRLGDEVVVYEVHQERQRVMVSHDSGFSILIPFSIFEKMAYKR